MSLLSAIRHTQSKSPEPYVAYEDDTAELVVDSIVVVQNGTRKDISEMIKHAFKKEHLIIERERDQWKEKAATLDDLLKEVRLLRAEIVLPQKSMEDKA